jgi:hypothetical protein
MNFPLEPFAHRKLKSVLARKSRQNLSNTKKYFHIFAMRIDKKSIFALDFEKRYSFIKL